MTNPDQQVRELTARVAETQGRLGAMTRLDPEREPLKAELASLLTELATAKEAAKEFATLRNFAGLMTPLHEVVVERFSSEVVRELDAAALARQEERNLAAAARRAAKTPPPEVPTPPVARSPGMTRREQASVEVIRRPGGLP